MEKCEDNNDISGAILAFDTLYTNNHMKICKMLLPFVDSKHQKLLCIYIKWQELVYTINFSTQYSVNLCSTNYKNNESINFLEIIPFILPYCTEKEKRLLTQFHQMQTMKKTYDSLQEYIPFIQQFMSLNSTSESTFDGPGIFDNFNLIDMIKNFLSEEQLSMFSMFMNNNEE